MILEIKKTYLLKFDPKYDVLNGIYTITDAYSHDRLIAEEVDLKATLDAMEFVADVDESVAKKQDNFIYDHRNEIFYEIKFANGIKKYHVPQSIVVHGDPDVFEYYNTMLAIELGPQKNPEIAFPIGDILIDALRCVMGDLYAYNPTDGTMTDPETGLPAILNITAKPNIYGKVWLSNVEYQEMITLRKNTPHGNPADKGIRDYYAEYVKMKTEKEILSSRVKILESIIRSYKDPAIDQLVPILEEIGGGVS